MILPRRGERQLISIQWGCISAPVGVIRGFRNPNDHNLVVYSVVGRRDEEVRRKLTLELSLVARLTFKTKSRNRTGARLDSVRMGKARRAQGIKSPISMTLIITIDSR
jgi:hypothetical protein